MKTRIIVAVIGIPLLLIVLLALPPIATGLLVAAMSVIAVYEMCIQTGLAKNLPLAVVSAIMALGVSLWSAGGCPLVPALVGLWIYFFALFAIMISAHTKLPFTSVCIAAFSGIVIPLLLSALTRILLMEYGKYYIMIPLVLAFSSDSGAYFVGVAIGKHKMAPVISPKKSWEGAVGGVLSAILCMFIYALVLDLGFHFEVRYPLAILYGILGSIAGIIGDLTYSVIKRQTGIKDYGNLLPGHGGILDRFDSMSIVAPLSEILLILFPLIVK